MEPFTQLTGTAIVLNRANVDTDAIIPKQFLKRVPRTGYGPFLFYDWRYTNETICRIDEEKCDYILDREILNVDFELNRKQTNKATILVAGNNFGCGSSREHAVWALMQYGFRAIIAPKVGDTPAFADIFRNNSYKNGLLPIELEEVEVQEIRASLQNSPEQQLVINLEEQTVQLGEKTYHFSIDDSVKEKMLKGLDDIGMTLLYNDKIAAYEGNHHQYLG
jgi:3-isopropylmalate/(R)-2-methylmalate dehydratase small subunit